MRLRNHYFLLRHGKTTWENSEICYPPDNRRSVRLSKEGKAQIKQAAEELEKQGIDLIFSSDYLRVRQTAEIVARAVKIKPLIDKRLGDTDLGVYWGRPKAEFYQDFSPDPLKRFKMKPSGGESLSHVQKRVADFLKSLEKKYKREKILIVGHGDSLWFFEGAARGLSNQKLLNLAFVKKRFIQKGELRKIN